MASNMDNNPSIIWNEYVYLEEDFIKCIRYLPLISENYNVWSAHFADLIIRIGSVFDSFLKRAIFCESLNDVDGIDECRKKYKNNKIGIVDYHHIFEKYFKLSSQTLYEFSEFEIISPFSKWSGDYDCLEWWGAYTALKHDRFVNKEVATLEATINALGGLFLLNVLYSETGPILVDNGIIKSSYANEFLKDLVSGKQEIGGKVPIYAKTKLFGYVFELEMRPFSNEDKIYILSPSYHGAD